MKEVKEKDVKTWLRKLKERNLKKTTISDYLSTLSTFYQHFLEIPENSIDYNPAKRVKKKYGHKANYNCRRRHLTVDEMSGFVKSIHHPRDRAMIVLALKTGMRRAEVVGIQLKDLEFDESRVFVPEEISKSVRNRYVPIDLEAQREIERYLSIRPNNSTPKVFLKRTGSRMTPMDFYRRVVKHAEKKGLWKKGGSLEENVTTHYFRHWFTTQMRRARMSDAILKDIRGDVPDIVDGYTHFTWDEKLTEYNRCIFKLGI